MITSDGTFYAVSPLHRLSLAPSQPIMVIVHCLYSAMNLARKACTPHHEESNGNTSQHRQLMAHDSKVTSIEVYLEVENWLRPLLEPVLKLCSKQCHLPHNAQREVLSTGHPQALYARLCTVQQ